MPTTLPFALSVRESATEMLIAVEGELDTVSAPRLRQLLATAALGPGESVVLDVSRMSFIDSSGLGVLAGAHRRLRAAGSELRLRAPTNATIRVLELTGLHVLIPVEPGALELDPEPQVPTPTA